MRFSFAGGADVPDWVRATHGFHTQAKMLPHDITSCACHRVCAQLLSQTFVVSKISAVKIKLLAKLVLQQARGEPADEAKLAKLLGDKLEPHEIKGVVAALHFILTCSARYDVAEEALALELQQLGLPKEHSEALVAALRDGRAAVQQHLANTSLCLPRLESLRWRVHAIGAASPDDATDHDEAAAQVDAHALELLLGVRDQPAPTAANAEPPPLRPLGFRLDADTLALLQAELRTAKEAVEAVQPRK